MGPISQQLENLFERAEQSTSAASDEGALYHVPGWIAAPQADELFLALRSEIPWQHDQVVLFGKRIVTARKSSWHAEPGLSYRYSGITRQPQPWTPTLALLRAASAQAAATPFNSCLANLYHHGGEGMGWHADNEKEIVRHSTIASLSFGATRRFDFKHRKDPKRRLSIELHHGDLLLMAGACQEHWLHALAQSKRVTEPRINLTFRLLKKAEHGIF